MAARKVFAPPFGRLQLGAALVWCLKTTSTEMPIDSSAPRYGPWKDGAYLG